LARPPHPLNQNGPGEAGLIDVASVPEITRMIARIQEWRDSHGKPGGRAEAALRLDEAHKLLAEIGNMLTEMRRELLGGHQR
jgi:hypothetical protein